MRKVTIFLVISKKNCNLAHNLKEISNKMTDSKYKVTVGMPVYGVEKYIHKSLLSVLNQTYKNDFEILVVDDLGPDNSMDIVRELQNSHPRGNNIRILTQPKNMGCWAARNRILEEAQENTCYYLTLMTISQKTPWKSCWLQSRNTKQRLYTVQ
jgi:cellulose synthase/poly-beta-1,6-N-acetylglucosamine synthase-like glycosyltransferase